MAVSLPILLDSLTDLPPNDLQEVALRTKALLSISPPPFAAATDYLLDGIYYELHRRGLIARGMRLPVKRLPVDFEQHSHDVRELLEQHLPRLKPVEQAALGQLAARCLAKYMERIHRPIAPKAMLEDVHRIPKALDNAFPGYLKSGMLQSLLEPA